MESRAKFLGHAIHPIMIVFPLGLLATAVVFDIIYLIWGSRDMASVAYWMMAAGIIGGLIAAPFGLIDWLAIPSGTRAKNDRAHAWWKQFYSTPLVRGQLGASIRPA
jgi:uncharacterized membrane protein